MIDEKLLLPLCKLVEKQIVSSLIAQGYVAHDNRDLTFKNITINPETYKLLNLPAPEQLYNDEKLLTDLLELFPKQSRCSKEVLKSRFRTFLEKTSLKNITREEILNAAVEHNKQFDYPYCGLVKYFFYKIDKDTRSYESRLEKLIEDNRNDTRASSPIIGKVDLSRWRL